MTNTSYNLTGKIDNITIDVLSEISRVANHLEIPFFVVGATARDLILQHLHNIHTSRATMDIDFGVQVSGWVQFEALRRSLVDTGKFNVTKQTQRLEYENGFPVDIIPFGGIAKNGELISWPPEFEIEMNIAGFQECYRHAITVKINEHPDLTVKVASLAGLAVMKIVSWDDNPERRGKDASDLYLIIRNYIEAGNLERFYEEESDILEKENADYDFSSARFLGRDMGRLANSSTKKKLIEILERERSSKHGHKIAMNILTQDLLETEPYEKIKAFFDALLKGVIEAD